MMVGLRNGVPSMPAGGGRGGHHHHHHGAAQYNDYGMGQQYPASDAAGQLNPEFFGSAAGGSMAGQLNPSFVHGWDDVSGPRRGHGRRRHHRQQQQQDGGGGYGEGGGYGMDDDTVGLGWSDLNPVNVVKKVITAANPVNQYKALKTIISNPLHPIDQFNALRSMVPGMGGSNTPGGPPAGAQTAALQQMFRGRNGRQYTAAQHAAWLRRRQQQYQQYQQQAQYIPPGGYVPQYQQQQQYTPSVDLASYDPNAYVPPVADWGDQPTGWSAAYGSGDNGPDDGTFDAAVDAGY